MAGKEGETAMKYRKWDDNKNKEMIVRGAVREAGKLKKVAIVLYAKVSHNTEFYG